MSVNSHQKKKRRENHYLKFRTMGNHEEFLQRITKTLYYSKLPVTERFSLPLSELAVELYSETKLGKSLERLRIEDASEISRNACISPCSMVLAVIYLEQLKTTNPVYVDKVAPSELFLISLMIASKFLNDNGEEDDVLNSEWATSANLTLSELNKLEKEFLDAIDWKVFVKDDQFWRKLRVLETMIALNEGKKRGWFSYTELEALLDQMNAFLLAQAVFTVSAICLASYAAGMMTVIGSTMVATQLVYNPSMLLTRSTYDPHLWTGSFLPITPITEDSDDFLNGTVSNFSNVAWCQPLKMTSNVILNEGFIKENSSKYYNILYHPSFRSSYNLMGFQDQWKQPALYLVSK